MSIELKICAIQLPQKNNYPESFKKKFFGKTKVANIDEIYGNKLFSDVYLFKDFIRII
jgi:hypothetical protein